MGIMISCTIYRCLSNTLVHYVVILHFLSLQQNSELKLYSNSSKSGNKS